MMIQTSTVCSWTKTPHCFKCQSSPNNVRIQPCTVKGPIMSQNKTYPALAEKRKRKKNEDNGTFACLCNVMFRAGDILTTFPKVGKVYLFLIYRLNYVSLL